MCSWHPFAMPGPKYSRHDQGNALVYEDLLYLNIPYLFPWGIWDWALLFWARHKKSQAHLEDHWKYVTNWFACLRYEALAAVVNTDLAAEVWAEIYLGRRASAERIWNPSSLLAMHSSSLKRHWMNQNFDFDGQKRPPSSLNCGQIDSPLGHLDA